MLLFRVIPWTATSAKVGLTRDFHFLATRWLSLTLLLFLKRIISLATWSWLGDTVGQVLYSTPQYSAWQTYPHLTNLCNEDSTPAIVLYWPSPLSRLILIISKYMLKAIAKFCFYLTGCTCSFNWDASQNLEARWNIIFFRLSVIMAQHGHIKLSILLSILSPLTCDNCKIRNVMKLMKF